MVTTRQSAAAAKSNGPVDRPVQTRANIAKIPKRNSEASTSNPVETPVKKPRRSTIIESLEIYFQSDVGMADNQESEAAEANGENYAGMNAEESGQEEAEVEVIHQEEEMSVEEHEEEESQNSLIAAAIENATNFEGNKANGMAKNAKFVVFNGAVVLECKICEWRKPNKKRIWPASPAGYKSCSDHLKAHQKKNKKNEALLKEPRKVYKMDEAGADTIQDSEDKKRSARTSKNIAHQVQYDGNFYLVCNLCKLLWTDLWLINATNLKKLATHWGSTENHK